MKYLFRAIVFIPLYLLLSACSGTSQSMPVASPGATSMPTITPNPTATATLEHTSTSEYVLPTIDPTLAHDVHTPVPEYVPPTLIPTIDPTLVPGLLKDAFSVQTLEGAHRHNVRQITGWDYGFGGGLWQYSCSGYYWLDSTHLLLYPAVGQVSSEAMPRVNVVQQPVVINIESGNIWLPPANESASPLTCNRVYWSRELGILITSELHDGNSTVVTYTYDELKLSSYPGGIASISPSRTRVLLGDNTLIDLRTNKKITLNWSLEDYHEEILSGLFWSSDETRIYRCCYFYADLTTGTSHRFERSDFQDTSGNHLDPGGLWFQNGEWVRNDTYFLVEWSWVDDGDIRYLPLLDPAKKRFSDLRQKLGISEDWRCQQTRVSPDGLYLWMTGWGEEEEGSYLVDLFTFESQYYPGREYLNIDWSPSSKFAWLFSSDPSGKTETYSILSIEDKEIKPVPVPPMRSGYWWNNVNDVLAYPSEDKNSLIFLDASTLSFRELSINAQRMPDYSINLAWSPNGERIAFTAEDGSIWQVEYPTLENLEQLTPASPEMHDMHWSPDGSSIAFISGSDIYIVETTHK
jgi:hypothetical protein